MQYEDVQNINPNANNPRESLQNLDDSIEQINIFTQ